MPAQTIKNASKQYANTTPKTTWYCGVDSIQP
jgi:hypothetical protein